ncbi:MAG: hypothetical protein DMG72_11155 [Acidobacteria bacterium]|nr:MAG: hypothetical protein DMG72_11155 [Acidobacteriota bacterium]
MLAAGEKDLASDAAKIAISDQVQIEDIAICEAVQKNLHSRSYHPPPLQCETGKRCARLPRLRKNWRMRASTVEERPFRAAKAVPNQ